MIKMFINDEEVVSNKELSIKEEMLATPSTILNNCYPKAWENVKDYVSKFYYPRDYSRCIIAKGFERGEDRSAMIINIIVSEEDERRLNSKISLGTMIV